MNRRDFFKAASAAPIAAPAAIKAAVAAHRMDSFAIGGMLKSWNAGYFGESVSETIIPKNLHLALNGIVDEECAQMRARFELMTASGWDADVLAQMDEHDLFEPRSAA